MGTKITAPLRAYADGLDAANHAPYAPIAHELERLADAIDHEHGERLESCRRETKRAFAHYIRSITAEYERGIKRKRKVEDWD